MSDVKIPTHIHSLVRALAARNHKVSFLLSRGGWAALPRGAMGFSVVCDCGIS